MNWKNNLKKTSHSLSVGTSGGLDFVIKPLPFKRQQTGNSPAISKESGDISVQIQSISCKVLCFWKTQCKCYALSAYLLVFMSKLPESPLQLYLQVYPRRKFTVVRSHENVRRLLTLNNLSHTHTSIHIHKQTHTKTHTHTNTHTRTNTHIHTNTNRHPYAHKQANTHIFTHI